MGNLKVFKYDGYTFNNVSCVLGDKKTAKNLYCCEIRSENHQPLETVIIFANNFGDVKWCLTGYLGKTLEIWDTEVTGTKHLYARDDSGLRDMRFYVCACRED